MPEKKMSKMSGTDCEQFEIGEYIIYGMTGVCKVEDITTLDMDGVAKDRLYYVLQPLNSKNGRIFTPVDNVKCTMRRVLSREEAFDLIDQIPSIDQLWITNDKQKEEKYKAAIKSCDCREWIGVTKTLYLQKQKRLALGKRLTEMEEKYLKMAEEHLFSELSIPLEIPKEEMEQYIVGRIEQ